MSGTQSTLTDRTPNILNKDPTDRKPKNDKSSLSLKHEFDPTGLVQRCVIIQRDENGFGLTVSGDNPVFVQLVKADGAAMRAGVQTGDRIIKVNGTLVIHSNHLEVVKLIKSGSYVALTVLGRPPGLSQILLEEEEEEEEEEQEEKLDDSELCTRLASPAPNSPALSGGDQSTITSTFTDGDESSGCRWSQAEEGDVELVTEPTSPPNNSLMHCSSLSESPGSKSTPCQSPDVVRKDGPSLCSSPDTEDAPDTIQDCSPPQCTASSPPYLLNLQIIGAEDEYFDSQQEQINGECSCFQSVDLLKSRPAHLAVFLHHVVSQFDPTPLLCYLYADMHKQTSSKESRRFFMEFHSLFMDRNANLKVAVPEVVTAELEKRRIELLPEDLCKQYTQTLQDALLPDLHKNLEDFRQKRSMGLTLAEDELSKLDLEEGRDQQAVEKECCCAEHVLTKIEDILLTTQPSEEEKCQTMQYVILTYMKHLGVKVKEPRGLEHKRARINFLPKMKKSIKPEKDGEEKVKKPRFSNILGPPRRLIRVDSTSVGKAELNKQRSPKLPQPHVGIPEVGDCSTSGPARTRANQLSDGSDTTTQSLPSTTSPTLSSPSSLALDTSGHDSDSNHSPFCIPPRLSDGLQSNEQQDGVTTPTSTQFDFSSSNIEQREEDQEAFRIELPCAASPTDVHSEDDQGGEVECEEDPLNWQRLVSRDVLASLTPQEIKRQEVVNELFYTEHTHLKMLKVLDCVFYQRLNRDGILPPDDIKHIFINLEEITQLHVSLMDQMNVIRKKSETSVIGQIGDDLLGWFSEDGEERLRGAVGTFCSNQPSALELIKTRQKKDQRFNHFMQEAESNRLCRRLQLKDIIPAEMQRVTKYPLLLDNIAKYTEDGEEREKVKRAAECCKKVLNHVNQAVKEAENKQRLEEYQRRLDLSSLKQNENPLILELKNLDLTKRKMVHEGPLSWKVNKEKTIELYTILLEDIMVLLQKQDERLILKLHGKNLASTNNDSKHIFSPVIKLNTVLVRSVATDNKSFFVLSMSENGAQIYELTAQNVSDQRTWQCLITQRADAMKAKPNSSDVPQASPDAMEMISSQITKPSKEISSILADGDVHSSDIQATLSLNPFNNLKSEDEDEELTAAAAAAGGRLDEEGEEEEEEKVDEAELEAFMDGHLEDVETEEHQPMSPGSSKAEEALQTLSMLKQTLFTHLMSREGDEETERLSAPEPSSVICDVIETSEGSQKDEPQLPEPPQQNGGFVLLDFGGGSEESSTDDDVGVGCEGIDMRKLLSSSSQTESEGPDLSRQLMTHIRLLQAHLQYLKDVEIKYNMQQMHSDTTIDSDDNNNNNNNDGTQ